MASDHEVFVSEFLKDFHECQTARFVWTRAYLEGSDLMTSAIRIFLAVWLVCAAGLVGFSYAYPIEPAVSQSFPVVRLTERALTDAEWRTLVETVVAMHVQERAHPGAQEQHDRATEERAQLRAELATQRALRTLELSAIGMVLLGIYGPALGRSLSRFGSAVEPER